MLHKFGILILCVASGAWGENWFDGFSARDTVLYRCASNVDGIFMKFPSIPDCRPPPSTDNATAVTLTTYWSDYSSHMVKGQECTKKSHTNVVSSSAFGLKKKYLFLQEEMNEEVSAGECKEMIRTGKTPTNEILQKLGNGLLGTDNNDVPVGSWYKNVESVNKNFYVKDVWFDVDPETKTVYPIGTNTPNKCKVDDGICATKHGILIWDSNEHKTCRIMLGRTTPCLRTGVHMTCPETFTSIDGWRTTTICGVKVAHAKSGVMFSTSVSHEVDPEVMSHDEIMKAINRKHGNRVELGNLTDGGSLRTTQFGMHYDHIMKIIRDNNEAIISTFHLNDCRQNRMQLEMHIKEALKGNLDGLLYGLFRDPEIRGELAGDVIAIWRCRKVNIFYFLYNKMCTLEHPVRFMEDGQPKEGWLRPITHEIVDVPTLITCPSQPFHFVMVDGTVVHLGNKEIVVNMPTLPNPGAAIRPGMDTVKGFAPDAVFYPSSGGRKRTMTQAEALNNMFLLSQTLDDLKHGEIPKDEHQLALVNLLGDLITGLISLPFGFATIFKFAVFAIVGFGILYVLVVLGGLPLLLQLVRWFVGIVFRMFKTVVKGTIRTVVNARLRYDNSNPGQFLPSAPTSKMYSNYPYNPPPYHRAGLYQNP